MGARQSQTHDHTAVFAFTNAHPGMVSNGKCLFNPSIGDAHNILVRKSDWCYCIGTPHPQPNRWHDPYNPTHFNYLTQGTLWYQNGDVRRWISNSEDARLFSLRGELWAIYGMGVGGRHRLAIHNISRMGSRPIVLHYEHYQQFEKNWSPFVHDDTLMLLYSIHPTVVLECDHHTGVCTKRYFTTDTHMSIPSTAHYLRGGSQLVRVGEYYLGVCHTCQDGSANYRHAFYLCDAYPPFSLARLSPWFILPAKNNQQNGYRPDIQFVSGIYVDDIWCYLSYGISDCSYNIVKVKLSSVLTTCHQRRTRIRI